MPLDDDNRKPSAGSTTRAATVKAETAALWSAIRQERRAVDERATPGASRCGWLPQKP